MSSHSDSFAASGSSLTDIGPDCVCENHSSIFLLRPTSPASYECIESHLSPDRLTFANAAVVEHRHIWVILAGLQEDGLAVARGYMPGRPPGRDNLHRTSPGTIPFTRPNADFGRPPFIQNSEN
jgi:hypothetical protein